MSIQRTYFGLKNCEHIEDSSLLSECSFLPFHFESRVKKYSIRATSEWFSNFSQYFIWLFSLITVGYLKVLIWRFLKTFVLIKMASMSLWCIIYKNLRCHTFIYYKCPPCSWEPDSNRWCKDVLTLSRQNLLPYNLKKDFFFAMVKACRKADLTPWPPLTFAKTVIDL